MTTWLKNFDIFCPTIYVKNRNFTLQSNALPWIIKIYGIFEFRSFFEKYNFGCKFHFHRSSIFEGKRRCISTSPNPFMFAFATFFNLSNSLLQRRLNIFNIDLSHSMIYLKVINNILTTCWHYMPITNGSIRLWQLQGNIRYNTF